MSILPGVKKRGGDLSLHREKRKGERNKEKEETGSPVIGSTMWGEKKSTRGKPVNGPLNYITSSEAGGGSRWFGAEPKTKQGEIGGRQLTPLRDGTMGVINLPGGIGPGHLAREARCNSQIRGPRTLLGEITRFKNMIVQTGGKRGMAK